MPVYRKGPPLPLNTYLFQGKMCHVGTVQPECAKLKLVLVMLFLFQMPSLEGHNAAMGVCLPTTVI